MKLRLFWRRIHEFRSLSMCASAAKPLTKLSGHRVCIISKGNQSEYVRSVKATESSIPLNSHPFRCSSASQSEEEKLLQAAVVKQELSSRILDAFRNHELGGEEMWEKTWWKYDVPYPYVPQISPYICLLKDDCAMHVPWQMFTSCARMRMLQWNQSVGSKGSHPFQCFLDSKCVSDIANETSQHSFLGTRLESPCRRYAT